MPEVTATIIYVHPELLRKFDKALHELGINCSRSAAINFLMLKFLIDNGYQVDPFVFDFENIIESLYRKICLKKRKRRLLKIVK